MTYHQPLTKEEILQHVTPDGYYHGFDIDDVRSAYNGMKQYLHNRSQEFTMKNPEMGMSFADAEIMLEEWFPVFVEDKKEPAYTVDDGENYEQ